ncbi:hypothetical protein [Winogradskyella sp.]|uniref:hypothetical protein n=1 Tax=Winogradskyella sp. TaxID=1883156 RepID=UPI003513C6DA
MKRIVLVFSVVLLLVLGKFWIGIYEHDEFGSEHIFIKHRAIWKTYFYSPVGMSDLLISDLTIEKQKEQILFDEFVSSKGLSK